MADLKPGDNAPQFTAKDQNGDKVALKDYLGKKVVLYFYPEDDTPGCTAEACNLRDNLGSLKKKGIVVLGVSPDDVASHKEFEKKYKLNFTLVADTNKNISEKYGTWGEKNLYGNIVIGMKRFTFLINEEGKIDHIIKKVKTEDHAAQILKKWGID